MVGCQGVQFRYNLEACLLILPWFLFVEKFLVQLVNKWCSLCYNQSVDHRTDYIHHWMLWFVNVFLFQSLAVYVWEVFPVFCYVLKPYRPLILYPWLTHLAFSTFKVAAAVVAVQVSVFVVAFVISSDSTRVLVAQFHQCPKLSFVVVMLFLSSFPFLCSFQYIIRVQWYSLCGCYCWWWYIWYLILFG